MIQMREHSRTFRIVTEVPEQRPEGALIEAARERMEPKLSGRAAASAAGISDGRWRQIVNGYLSAGQGNYIPVVAPPETLARMARVVGVTPEDLTRVGREDAAGVLVRMMGDEIRNKLVHRSAIPVGTGSDPVDLTDLTPEEIEAVKAVIRAMRARSQD